MYPFLIIIPFVVPRSFVGPVIEEKDRRGKTTKSEFLCGMGRFVHKAGYNVLYGDGGVRWYADPTERITELTADCGDNDWGYWRFLDYKSHQFAFSRCTWLAEWLIWGEMDLDAAVVSKDDEARRSPDGSFFP